MVSNYLLALCARCLTYLAEEPEDFEAPEGWERVEEEGVGVRNPVALEIAHFFAIYFLLFINNI